MKISFILGAGFSKNAGLPLAKDIWNKLSLDNLENQILLFSSSEWKWKDTANETEKRNGSYSSELIPKSFLLKNSLLAFKGLSDPRNHIYEEFYQWLVDIDSTGPVWKQLVKQTRDQIEEKYRNNSFISRSQLIPRDLIFCLVHLVDDLLWPRKALKEYKHLYNPYLKLLN